MEDFKKNSARAAGRGTTVGEERETVVKSASEQRSELSHQERSAQQQNDGNFTGEYNYDEYDSYSPWE